MKRRRRGRTVVSATPPAPPAGVYRPFRELRDRLPRPVPPSASPAPRPPPSTSRGQPADDSAAADFAAAMAGVEPLDRPPAPARRSVPPPPAVDELALGERFLAALVGGEVPFDFADTDEYVEGSVRGLDAAIVRRLREGGYVVEADLDLHGLDRHEAKTALRDFLARAAAEGKRCVRVVHGRGLGSKDGIPVLRERLKEWLTRGGTGRRVLAFTSARPCDGGTGAVYVLLRGT